jgi:hypothetical protein
VFLDFGLERGVGDVQNVGHGFLGHILIGAGRYAEAGWGRLDGRELNASSAR